MRRKDGPSSQQLLWDVRVVCRSYFRENFIVPPNTTGIRCCSHSRAAGATSVLPNVPPVCSLLCTRHGDGDEAPVLSSRSASLHPHVRTKAPNSVRYGRQALEDLPSTRPYILRGQVPASASNPDEGVSRKPKRDLHWPCLLHRNPTSAYIRWVREVKFGIPDQYDMRSWRRPL